MWTVSAGIVLALTAFFAGDAFSWVTGIMLAAGLVWIAIAVPLRWAHFFLSFLAVQCCLNAFYDLRTLFLISATTDMQSDAANMAEATMIPATLWALIWIVISLLALITALRKYAEGQAV